MSAHGKRDEPDKNSNSSDAENISVFSKSTPFTEPSSVSSLGNSEPCLPSVPGSVGSSAKEGMEATLTRDVPNLPTRRRSLSAGARGRVFPVQKPDPAADDIDTQPQSSSSISNQADSACSASDQAEAFPVRMRIRCRSSSLRARPHSICAVSSVRKSSLNPNPVLQSIPSNKVVSTVPVQSFVTTSSDSTTAASSAMGPSRRQRSSSLSESPYAKARPDSAPGAGRRRRISSSVETLEDGMVPPFEETSLQASHDVVVTGVRCIIQKEGELVCGCYLDRDSEYKSHLVVGRKGI